MKKKIALCLLSSVLLILSFSEFNIELLAWIGFLPLFFAIKNKSGFKAFLLAYIAGVIFWLGIVYWLVHVTFAGMILMVSYLALYFGMFGLFFSLMQDVRYRIQERKMYLASCILNPLILPCCWVVLEYIRSHLFTGFGWALLGYSQYKNLPIIQVADITGAYGVSFLIVLVNVCIFKMIQDARCKMQLKKSYILYPLFCIFVVSIVLVYGFGKLNQESYGETIKTSVTQANIPQEFKWDRGYIALILDRYFILTKSATRDNPDLIIWPEASFPEVLETERLEESVKNIGALVLIGAVVWENGDYFNTALLISEKGELLERYNKLHLVPFGEYIPLRKLLGFLETVVPIGNFTKGEELTILQVPDKKAKFSVLICFEDVFPQIARGFTKRGAEFLVNITNDAWFGKTSAPYQHLSASVFRAVENRRAVIRSANTGISGFIDIKGRCNLLTDENGGEIFIQGIKTAVIKTNKYLTFYTKFGNIFVLVCIIIAILGVIISSKNKK